MLNTRSITLVPFGKGNFDLLVIPGFSNDAFNATVEAFNKTPFSGFIVKFNEVSEYAKKHVYIYPAGSKEKVKEETKLYKKLASLIQEKIKQLKKTDSSNSKMLNIIAKSAGAGVAWYLCQKLKINILYMQAPGFSDTEKITKTLKCEKIVLGWNKDDDKIKFTNAKVAVTFIKSCIKQIKAEKDKSIKFTKKYYLEGKHEWQSEFIELCDT